MNDERGPDAWPVVRAGGRAVVLGAGMAGLLVARVLSDSYDDVLLVDRDTVVGVTRTRRGVPQGGHAHALLARGQEILEDLFPGLNQGLIDQGIPVGDLVGNLRWYFRGRRLAQKQTGLLSVSATRAELEAAVRSRVLALPRVSILERTSVEGVLAGTDGTRVIAAKVHSEDDGPLVLPADLVVDATGRGSRAPVWLRDLGFPVPADDRIPVNLAYTTRHYQLDADCYGSDLSINPVAWPGNRRGAFFPMLADGTSMLSLTGILGDHPPKDEDGFLAFVRDLDAPEIYEAVRQAEPVDEAVTFKVPASIRRRYERLPAAPAGFLVVGDGICAFNPVYGQGMTVVALQADTLRRHLGTGAPRPLEFYREVAAAVDVAWETSATADLGFPGVAGPRSMKVTVANAFARRLHTAATVDARFAEAFFRVAGLVDPPTALMRPGFAVRVLRASSRVPPAPPVTATSKGSGRTAGSEMAGVPTVPSIAAAPPRSDADRAGQRVRGEES
jgi:2-polyprenyl-6-methoxyphenol hydroxylase-like FAD-dependent oxidoreductase